MMERGSSPEVDGAESSRDPSRIVTVASDVDDGARVFVKYAGGKGSHRSASRESTGDGNDCLICHKSVVDKKGPVTKLPCGRIYHKDCLFGWLLKNDEPKGLCVKCDINPAMDNYGGHCERCYGLHVVKCNESCANCEAVYPEIGIRLSQSEGCCVPCNIYQDECSCKVCDDCGGFYLSDGSPSCTVDDHLRIECECQFAMSP